MAQRLTRPIHGARIFRIAVVISFVLILAACAGSSFKPREACLVIEASPSLNLYDGEAHALNLFIYPMTGIAVFHESSIDDLVAGKTVGGTTGPPLSVMISPGEVREFREAFSPGTSVIGVVADYYQAGMELPGNRRGVVQGKCSFFRSDKIVLTSRDLLVE